MSADVAPHRYQPLPTPKAHCSICLATERSAVCQANDELHRADCPRPGFRYGATRPDGRVVMLCRDSRCPARRIA